VTRQRDAYLTARARRTWPGAEVWRVEIDRYHDTSEVLYADEPLMERTYRLRRRLNDWVDLGGSFGQARATLDRLAKEAR